MEAEGLNWLGRKANVVLDANELDKLTPHPAAFVLYCHLRRCHGVRVDPITVCAKAIGRRQGDPGLEMAQISHGA